MKALVTGAGGFVGRWLVRHLEEVGDEVLTSTDLDVRDADAVRHWFTEVEPEVVFHLAARSRVGESWQRPSATFEVNANGTLNVLDAALSCEVPPRVVLVSASDVYGAVPERDLPVTEASALAPISPLAASKIAAEYLGVQAWLGTHLPVVLVRPFNQIGPGQASDFVVPALAQRIVHAVATGAREVSVGDLEARRDYTDVRDGARALRMLAAAGVPGVAYNLCSGRDVSVGELAGRLLALADVDLELQVDPRLLRTKDRPVVRGSYARLAERTGWAPEIGLDQTLRDVLEGLGA